MDVGTLFRLKGVVEAAAQQPTGNLSEAHIFSYRRVRTEVRMAIDPPHGDEFDRLFPEDAAAWDGGGPYGSAATEAIVLMNQMAGWLDGIIQAAVLDQRIRVEAEEKAKRTGFA